MKQIAVLHRSAGNEAQLRSILGLPDDAWTELEVRFGMGGFATATVTLLLSQDQVVALADVLSDIGENETV